MKVIGFIYELHLTFNKEAGISEEQWTELASNINRMGGSLKWFRLSDHGGINLGFFEFHSRSKLMQILRTLDEDSQGLNLKMVSIESEIKTAYEFYPTVYVTAKTIKLNSQPEFAGFTIPGPWRRIRIILYGYKSRTKVFKQMAKEYDIYKNLGHPLGNEETILALDSKGVSYLFLRDTFLGLWVK